MRNILEDLKMILSPIDVPVETGAFASKAPDQYIVIVPMIDNFDLYGDDKPLVDVQEARISIFAKTSYQRLKNQIVRAVVAAGLTVTQRQFIEYETDTCYYHYNVDVSHYYNLKITEE